MNRLSVLTFLLVSCLSACSFLIDPYAGIRCDGPEDCLEGYRCYQGRCSESVPRCGDFVVDAGEECDDGAESATCDADCTLAACGDQTVNATAGELCDDGNGSSTDACPDGVDGTCLPATCGDGLVLAGAEDCDTAGESPTCDADCTPAECGDGTLNVSAYEQCDSVDATKSVCTTWCLLACDRGFLDCDGNPGTGCECSGGAQSWLRQAGHTADGADIGRGIAALADGSALVVGTFCAYSPDPCEANFDPGVADTVLTSAGDEDVFVVKYAADGTLAWAKRAGGTAADSGTGVAAFADGSFVVSGTFCDAMLCTATFGTSEQVMSIGDQDTFVARYRSNGTLSWVRTAGSVQRDRAAAVAAMPDGSVIAVGSFCDTSTCPIAFGTTALTSSGRQDGFVVRYDANGTFVWAKQVGGDWADAAQDVASLPDGSFFVTGSFCGDSTGSCSGFLDGTVLDSAGKADLFVAKYALDGTMAWVERAGGSGEEAEMSVASLPDGSALVTGTFCRLESASCNATFGRGGSAVVLTSAGGGDIFVAKYAADGTLVWAERAGSTVEDRSTGIASLPDGGMLIAGMFCLGVGCVADFGRNGDRVSLTSAGVSDVFVARYAADGILVWADNAGGAGMDESNAIAALPDGSALVTGFFVGDATFSGQALSTSGPTDIDIFVARTAGP